MLAGPEGAIVSEYASAHDMAACASRTPTSSSERSAHEPHPAHGALDPQ